MYRFWSNVHSLFLEWDWKWVQGRVQEQFFLFVIHTPGAKTRNLNSTLSGLNTFPERCHEVKTAKLFFSLLSWSEGDRETEKEGRIFFLHCTSISLCSERPVHHSAWLTILSVPGHVCRQAARHCVPVRGEWPGPGVALKPAHQVSLEGCPIPSELVLVFVVMRENCLC